MVDGLTILITSQGWMAPLWYVGGYLLAALVPIIPTPLIAALGGTAFGAIPAIVYGIVGMGLGAVISLTLARRLGLPLLRRMMPPAALAEWEGLLGIRSPWTWGVIFLVVNLDVAVMASGLSSLPLRQLWTAAMVARVPWLVGSAFFGDLVLVNDSVLLLILLLAIPALWGANRARPALARRLKRWVRRREPEMGGAAPEPTPPAPTPAAPPALRAAGSPAPEPRLDEPSEAREPEAERGPTSPTPRLSEAAAGGETRAATDSTE